MKALTICQPHAWGILHAGKRCENRTWETRYRGPLAIHAGKSRAWLRASPQYPGEPTEGDPALPFGAVVAVGLLVECLSRDKIPAGSLLAANPYVEGPWCWLLGDVRGLPAPVPCAGAMGLWDWTPPPAVEEWLAADPVWAHNCRKHTARGG